MTIRKFWLKANTSFKKTKSPESKYPASQYTLYESTGSITGLMVGRVHWSLNESRLKFVNGLAGNWTTYGNAAA